MKKLFLLFALFGVLAVGCEELLPNEQKPGDNSTEQPEGNHIFITDSESSYTVVANGGKVEVAVTTNLEYSVVISEDAEEWLSVADTRVVVREDKLTFVVAVNESFDERSASAELVNGDGEVLQTITFIQDGQSKTFDSNGKDSYTIQAIGGEVNVVVTTNIEYNVNIPEAAQEWLSVADTRALVREETLTFIVAENETFEERSASVELVNGEGEVLQIIAFVQRGQTKVFESDGEGSYTIKAIGGEVSVAVTTNLEYSVVISEDAKEWLSVADTRAVVREETLTFIVAENKAYDRRMTAVELVDTEGNVLQIIEFIQRAAVMQQFACPSDEIWYTNGSTTNPTTPNNTNAFDANILSNTYYEDSERWVIKFDGEVTTIGNSAFYYCSGLTSVTIPDSVTTIGDNAFSICNSLTSVTIPDSVTEIGNGAFAGCTSLKEFKGKYATEDGRSLIVDNTIIAYANASGTTYTIPDSVTTIGNYAFYDCESLTSVTIPDSVTSIGESAFSRCESLTSVTIPDSVTTIGNTAFYGCSSLTSVTIGNSVTTIGGNAFAYCSSLTSVTIPDSVTTIGNCAFDNCSSLESITIPDSITTIGNLAFSGCSCLTNVLITDLSAWCKIDFGNASANPLSEGANLYLNNQLVTVLVIPSNITEIKSYAFNCYDSLIQLIIPDSVTTIGEEAFHGCSSLTSVTIGDSVTTIGDCAFLYCGSLASVTIGDSVTMIGDWAFAYCKSLESVTIGDSVTTIGIYAFHYCSSLTSVTIPDSVTTIGSSTFSDCRSLTSVYCKATTPPAGGNFMFPSNASGRKIYVPMESVEAYKSASGWSEYASDIVGYYF